MNELLFIIYVSDQNKSTRFYSNIFQIKPILNVPGMTEFQLSESTKFGIMPEEGISKLLQNKTPHPSKGQGIPRCELYLKVTNAQQYIERALKFGGKEISKLQKRNWGDKVGYISDIDGHIIAFAEQT